MSDMSDDFRKQMLRLGVVSYREQETLWDIARRCARTTGVPLGGAGAVGLAGAGAVTIPGIGAVPGAVAGFLGGFVTGTAMCTAANVSYRDQLRQLLDDY